MLLTENMKKKDKMNRIILIGNGFDLAHGLKTKYEHFIDDFWKRASDNYKSDKRHDGSITKNFEHENSNVRFFEISEEKEMEIKKGTYTFNGIIDFRKTITYKNKFLEKIDQDIQVKNWCNIEKLYFDELVRCYNEYKVKNDRNDTEKIDKLNKDFEEIENELREYFKKEVRGKKESNQESLILENNTVNDNFLSELQEIFIEEIYAENIAKYLILTCNYTRTAELYIRKIVDRGVKKEDVNIIYIHGNLDSKIIFGYGDEYCDESKEIERLDENKFQKYVKQIKYAETPFYMTFDKFIANGDYQVIILGHSCGNTDRTLLRRLLETGRCKEIIPYYYDDIDKSERLNNIYRIFDDKQKFQERIKPLEEWKQIPCIDRLKKAAFDLMVEKSFIKIEKPHNNKYLLKDGTEREIKQDFFIGKYQVTQQLWQKIMQSNPSYFQADGAKKPVDRVSWYDCVEFCNKLTEHLNDNINSENSRTKYYRIEKDVSGKITKVESIKGATGFRLPTEAEWEYAARRYSRNDKAECKVYAGSTYNKDNDDENELAKYAWFYENSDGATHEVGTAKNANELAIHDMSGNVLEWCEDDWEGKLTNEKQGSNHVLRGGGWHSIARSCRVSGRRSIAPDFRSDRFGFRLALVP